MMKKQEIDWRIVCTAIGGVTVLECVAINAGFNGMLLKSVLVGIALVAGITIPNPIKIK